MSGSARPMNPERGADWATGKGRRPGVGASDSLLASSAATPFGDRLATQQGIRNQRVQRTNVRRLYEQAIVTGDDELLMRVQKYLVGQGWIGGAPGQLDIEDAIAAVERG